MVNMNSRNYSSINTAILRYGSLYNGRYKQIYFDIFSGINRSKRVIYAGKGEYEYC
jgi:hypothetical protein